MIDWNTLEHSHQQAILDRLHLLIDATLQEALFIEDAQLLQEKCQRYQVRFRPEWSPYTWAHALLRAGMQHIQNPSRYGFQIKPAFQHYTIPQLIEYLDDRLFAQAGRT